MSIPRNDSSSNLLLVNYGEEDSDIDSEEDGEIEKTLEDETEEQKDSLPPAEVSEQAEPSPQPPAEGNNQNPLKQSWLNKFHFCHISSSICKTLEV